MNKNRRITLRDNYTPLPTYEGDEIYPNGIFNFNISRIYDHIKDGTLAVEEEQIHVQEWFKYHYRGSVNEEHLPTVDMRRTVIQAEIRPGIFEIIDGNHRMEKANREGVPYVNSYKIHAEQLLPYFIDERGYITFVNYWNMKVKELDIQPSL